MSAYVGQMVYFGIFYDGNYAWYIWVDDVTFPDGSFQGFEGTPAVPGYFPGWTQTAYGTSTYNKFDGVSVGTSPACTPAEGTLMARYQSYNIPSGQSCLLTKTAAFDFTAPITYNLDFQMYHDSGYASSTDLIYPLMSPD
jgi:hypothetical protein